MVGVPSPDAAPSLSTLEESAMQTELAKELLDLEMQFWKSMKDKDVDTALRLTYEPCIVAGAQGVASIDKQTFAKMMATGTWIS